MTYQVVLTQQAARELEAIADWWAIHRDREQAARWYEGFSEKIASLSEDPERFPLAEENEDFPYLLRELSFGLSSRPTHRAVYTVTEENVVVLSIRHGAQSPLTPDDVFEDPGGP